MRIITWNINGIRAVYKKGFSDWLNKEKPDILCLQEIKIKNSQLTPEIQAPEGYETYWNHAERPGYSGVATFSLLPFQRTETGFGFPEYEDEGRTLVHYFDDFILYNIYFPNGQKDENRLNYKLRFYADILTVFDKHIKNGDKLIVCGDFNTAHRPIDLKNPKANENYSGFLPIEREWIDRYIDHGLTDVYRHLYPEKVEYTWWTYRFNARKRNIGWRIDYFFVSENVLPHIKDIIIMTEVTGSDHCPVQLQISG